MRGSVGKIRRSVVGNQRLDENELFFILEHINRSYEIWQNY